MSLEGAITLPKEVRCEKAMNRRLEFPTNFRRGVINHSRNSDILVQVYDTSPLPLGGTGLGVNLTSPSVYDSVV